MLFLKNKSFKSRTLSVTKGSPLRKNRTLILDPLFLSEFSRMVILRFKQNNLFCNLIKLASDPKKSKTLSTGSSGVYINRQKIHSKKPKVVLDDVLNSFFFAIKNMLTLRGIFVKIVASKGLKKKLINKLTLLKTFKKDKVLIQRLLFIKVNDQKCFNGCRSSKRRRKKQKGKRKSLRCFK